MAPTDGNSRGTAEQRTFAPSTVDMVFVLILLVRGLTYAGPLLHGDGDTAGHIALGRLIIDARSLPATDPFTFTMSGEPLLAHSWLGSVLWAWLHDGGGMPALAVFATVALALCYALVALFLRSRGVDGRIVLLGAVWATMIGSVHWLARPHIFTTLFAIVLLLLLERQRPIRWWWTAILFLLWTNLHGGFAFGLLLLGIYTAGAALELAFDRSSAEWRTRTLHLAKLLGVALLATLVNPYGWRIYSGILGAAGAAETLTLTEEYASPNFHDPSQWLLLAALLTCVLVLSLSTRRPAAPHLLVVLTTMGLSLYSVRHADLFAVTGWPLVILHAARQFGRPTRRYIFGDAFSAVERRAVLGPWIVLGVLLMLGLVLGGGRVGRLQLLPSGFHPGEFPVAAVAAARQRHLNAPIFHDFRWGGYLAYAWPEQRIFILGLKYDAEPAWSYLRIAQLQPGWERELERWGVRQILVPSGSALAFVLRQRPEWIVVHVDDTAIYLVRDDSASGNGSRGTSAR